MISSRAASLETVELWPLSSAMRAAKHLLALRDVARQLRHERRRDLVFRREQRRIGRESGVACDLLRFGERGDGLFVERALNPFGRSRNRRGGASGRIVGRVEILHCYYIHAQF